MSQLLQARPEQREPQSVFDATVATFEQEVMLKSMQVPVLVDFWAAWCGPCKNLAPLLEKVVGEYQGQVLLAKVDTDREQELAAAFGIRSLPTVVLFRGGQPVDGFMGLVPESDIRALLEKHIGPAPAALPQEPVEAAPAALDERLAEARSKAEAEPENSEARFALIQLLIRAGADQEAEQQLAALPDKLSVDRTAERLRGQLQVLRSVADAPDLPSLRARLETDPDDLQARHQLATRLLLAGQAEPALVEYLELLKRDRNWSDGLPRKSLIAAFDLTEDAELVGIYRRKMASVLF